MGWTFDFLKITETSNAKGVVHDGILFYLGVLRLSPLVYT